MPGGERAERLLVRLLFVSVILFFTLQIISDLNESLSSSRKIYPAQTADWPEGSPVVTFYLQDYFLMPHLRVLVNGEVKGAFSQRYVTVAVQDGDSLSVDGTFYTRQVRVEVLDVSKEVLSPGKGLVFTLSGNVAPLGRVRINRFLSVR